MRTFNVKFFFVLLGGVAVLAGGLFLLHQFQQDRIAGALLFQAEHARQDNQPEKAAEYYFRYLEFKPDDRPLWQQRAMCEEGMARYDAAVKAFEKAIEFPPDQVRSHELFARLLRKRLNKNQQADDTIQQMVERHGHSHEAWLARARY